MTTIKTYTTAGAFRRALEERLKQRSQTDHIDFNRLRRQVPFDRFLARLFREEAAPWALKGGYALELRFKGARLPLISTWPCSEFSCQLRRTLKETWRFVSFCKPRLAIRFQIGLSTG